MNSVERVAAAIALRQPDRVPVDLHNFQPAARALGIPMPQIFRNGELLAEAMLQAWKEFGHDMILLENGTGCNAEACGAHVTYRDDAAPVADEPLLEKLEDVQNRAYAYPHEKKMVEDLKARGIVLANHICGNTVPILADFVATGAQILEIDHKTDMRQAKNAARGKTCLLGPLNTSLLASGTPQAVEDACREAIEILAPGSGFILGPGCALGPETPPDNIHSLVESAKKYGSY